MYSMNGMNPMMSGGVGMMPPGPPMGMMPSMNMMPMSGPPMGSMGMGMMGGQGMYQDDYGMRNIQQVVQAPPMMMEKHFFNNVMQPPAGPNFEMEPEFMERIVEIPRVNIDHRERLVEVPQPQVVDRIVEVPQIQEIIKEEPGEVFQIPMTREAPVIEFCQETLPPLEISQVQYQDRYVEVPQIQEVLRVIPRIEVREIPVERIIQVPKKIIQEIERPIFRPVPHLIQQAVERQIPVPRTQIQTLEVVKQIPMPIMQQVDVQVNYPMPVPMAMPQPMMMQQVPVPVPQPYAVEVEKRVEVPCVQTQIIEKIVEVPVAVPVQQQQQVVVQPPMTMQTRDIVYPPVSTGQVGEAVEVSRSIIGTQMMQPQTMTVSNSYVAPAATPPRMMSMQQVPMASSQTILQPPMTTFNGPPTIIGASQRVGAMTPPTPPVVSRSMGSAPIMMNAPPMPMVSGPLEMRAASMTSPMLAGSQTNMQYTNYGGAQSMRSAPSSAQELYGGPRELVSGGYGGAPSTNPYGLQGNPTPPMPPTGAVL